MMTHSKSPILLLGGILALVSLGGPAQAPRAPATRMFLGPHPAPFLALSVADLDRQLAWYRDTLGFSVYSQGTMGPAKIRFALLLQGDALVELLQIPGARPRSAALPGVTDPSQVHGFFKGGMVVADVAGLFAALQRRGVPFAFRLSQPPGGPYRVFGVTDPEGNLLQFFGR